MKALIIKQPWIDLILKGSKTWEIRGSNTSISGQIELIQSGSSLVVGCCEIVDCKELSLEEFQNCTDKHCINNTKELPYKRAYAWIIKNAERYKELRKYKHPNGAIVWGNL